MQVDEINRRIRKSESLKKALTKLLHQNIVNCSEVECYDYFNTHLTEVKTIYGQLEGAIGQKVEPAPDDWDRTYGVDFFIKIDQKYIGIQIKPIASGLSLNQYQWIKMHKKSHERFEKDFGGKVFFVFSTKSSSGTKKIYNTEVIEQIIVEVNRLRD